MDSRAASLAQQAALYGAPLGDSVGSVTSALGLSQAAVAKVLGLSAPMLSQLVSGQRIKIGNPLVVQRLQALLALAVEVDSGLAHDRIEPRLEQIRSDTTGTLTGARRTAGGTRTEADVPLALSRLLRAVASGRDLLAAADAVQADHPDLAEVLRVYGTGTEAEARRHYASLGRPPHR